MIRFFIGLILMFVGTVLIINFGEQLLGIILITIGVFVFGTSFYRKKECSQRIY